MPGRNHRKKSTKRSHKKHQKGGAGYTLTDCRIGGLSEVRAYSECPQNVGPGSAEFAKALYSAPILFSSNQAGGSHHRRRKSKTLKRHKKLTKADCRK
jgi:hypothetical protein